MCGRFINLTKTNFIKKKFNIKNSVNKDLISYNISPTQNSCIIFMDKEINLDIAKWGYLFFDKTNSYEKNIINSRLETIKDKILFKESYINRKCIIPINGYYEWSLVENIKVPFFIHIPISEPMYLAGIWKYINYKDSKQKAFTVITKKSNKNLSNIHYRMPVILSFEESEEYLIDNTSCFLNINFSSTIESELDFYSVSTHVNNPVNNSNKCITPLHFNSIF